MALSCITSSLAYRGFSKWNLWVFSGDENAKTSQELKEEIKEMPHEITNSIQTECDLQANIKSARIMADLPASRNPKQPSLKNLECTLESKELWRKFHDLGTEMIITKTGR